MRILLDTHMLIWLAGDMLPKAAVPYIKSENNTLLFSPMSIWEIVIKTNPKRPDFEVDAFTLYQDLLLNGYEELVVTSRHALKVNDLPLIHKDPFDRMLIAQAIEEDIALLTSDDTVAKYPGNIIFVKK
ncbi:MAG: type II toxin-antitoxin system VapC family toxin [Spirochaetaceae bacterium]|jgi:PIN domain nuclease of toxin-antitoxin system|nr:type II toxin-antitoxin system VapC family toxin [Spirochaetaceae bacterium]